MRTGFLEINDAANLKFMKGSNNVALQAPASITNSYAWTFPADLPASPQLLQVSATGQLSYVSAGSGGSVTSVALSLPSIFTVSGSPITTSGTLSATLASQASNLFFASPTGAAGAPTFRSLVYADLSALVGSTSNTLAAGNDSRFHTQGTDTGTTQTSFQVDSGNSGFRIKNASGVLQVRNAGDTAYADVRVNNLIVEGTTTTVNSETVTINDNILELNSNVTTGTPTEDLGIEGKRGASSSATLRWIESSQSWFAGTVVAPLPIVRVFEQSFTNASLTSGILTVTHNLGKRYGDVNIINNNNQLIIPDNITYTSITATTVDLTSFGTLTGTWTVNVQG
jgi:hypothetical protein